MLDDDNTVQRLSVDLRMQFEAMHASLQQHLTDWVATPEQGVVAMHALVRHFVAQLESDSHWIVRLIEDTDTQLKAVLSPQPQTLSTSWEVHFTSPDGCTYEITIGYKVPEERSATPFYSMHSKLWVIYRPRTWIGRTWAKVRTAYWVRTRPELRTVVSRHQQDHDR